jgi:cobalamin biosynthesis protein CobC
MIDAPTHGGNLSTASVLYGTPAAGWLDLSTGINPNRYPFQAPPLEVHARLPDQAREQALVGAAQRYYGTPAEVMLGAGSQAFIQSLPKLRPVGKVAVLSPTYAEHAHAWRAAGHEVIEQAEDADISSFGVVVAVNPNNPDGRLLSVQQLMDMHAALATRGGWLIVDEAFADTEPKTSIADHAGVPGLVVLRSFGKFFGLAGVRLGFALCDKALATALRSVLGPWSVSGPALHIGHQALIDAEWQIQARADLSGARKRIDKLLGEAGVRVLGGTNLFRLVETKSSALHEKLARAGIWTRAFDFCPDILRIGLPGSEADWKRLANALL